MTTFAFAVTGIPLLTIAADAAMKFRAGLDPSDALNHSGAIALVAAFAVAFLFRLIFWERVPSATQGLVRAFIMLVIGSLVIAMLAGAIFVYRSPAGFLANIFIGAGLLSQVASLVWLVRYRRE